jgi:hypothetical protein
MMAEDYHWACDPRTEQLQAELSALRGGPKKDAEGWATIEVPRVDGFQTWPANARVTGLFVAVRIMDPQAMLPIRVRMYMPSKALDSFSEVRGNEALVTRWFEDVMLGYATRHARDNNMVHVMCVSPPDWENYTEIEEDDERADCDPEPTAP